MAQFVNPEADIIGKNHALATNCGAAKGLQALVKSNLGPKGTMKMYVRAGRPANTPRKFKLTRWNSACHCGYTVRRTRTGSRHERIRDTEAHDLTSHD